MHIMDGEFMDMPLGVCSSFFWSFGTVGISRHLQILRVYHPVSSY